MEICELVVNLPKDSMIKREDAIELGKRHRDWVEFTGVASLNIWELDVAGNSWIDPRQLTFRSLPSRRKVATGMNVSGGSIVRSPRFRCSSNSILTFEVECSDCLLDVWQDKQLPQIGLYIEQYPSHT